MLFASEMIVGPEKGEFDRLLNVNKSFLWNQNCSIVKCFNLKENDEVIIHSELTLGGGVGLLFK